MLRPITIAVLLVALAGPAHVNAAAPDDWIPFDAKPDAASVESAIDLRFLNEKQAGDGAFIAVRDGQFVHAKTGEPIRFWAANGCPGNDPASLRRSAKVLARYGINLVRLHGPMFDADANVALQK